ncbi:MAG: O-antigen ligase family protein, partial [Chromatiales bacterium]|nr:O-antigen ligase family protein [Chromatiales bacterium]
LGLGVLTWRRADALHRPGVGFALMVFACLWLPMVFASIDAYDAGRSIEKTLLYLRFGLSTVVLVYVLRDARLLAALRAVVMLFAGLLIADSCLQIVTGNNILGFPYTSGQLRGVFYPKYRLGVILAIFTPLILDEVIQRSRGEQTSGHWFGPKVAWWLVFLPVPLIIALTLHRNSWMMFGFACAAYVLFRFLEHRWRPRVGVWLGMALVPVALVAALSTHAGFESRFGQAIKAFTEDRSTLNAVLGERPDIWGTALTMFAAHPVNGIGPRGFRSAYPDYASPDDYWMNLQPERQIPAHPHQLALEILAETGGIGGLGALAAVVLLVRRYRQLSPAARMRAGPWLICLMIATFPANIHKAFYGHFVATLVWWIAAAAIASLFVHDSE